MKERDKQPFETDEAPNQEKNDENAMASRLERRNYYLG